MIELLSIVTVVYATVGAVLFGLCRAATIGDGALELDAVESPNFELDVSRPSRLESPRPAPVAVAVAGLVSGR